MKKKRMIWSLILILTLALIVLIYHYCRIKFAKVEVVLSESLKIPVRLNIKISDMIESINGEILNDDYIDTKTLGTKNINIKFRNEEGIRVKYDFSVEVVDETSPIVWLNNQYTVNKGSDDSIFHKIMCADDYDPTPKCEVIGNYNMNELGIYPLVFKATDSSGNVTEKNFNLRVQEPPKKNNNTGTSSSKPTYTEFQSILNTYKNENTEIGLDISHWQGDVDYQALKTAGVEFVFLRVGTSNGIEGENILDKKFLQNIERATNAGIPVGIYFYSYANSEERAISDALWVLEQIKNYQIDLPIAFDWENWSTFNEYHLSLFGLTDIASSFLKVIEDAGYEGLLYSSKSYLEQVWYPTEYKTWLAHYTSQTNYQGDYDFWQLCSDGAVNGINGAVDINIRYKK